MLVIGILITDFKYTIIKDNYIVGGNYIKLLLFYEDSNYIDFNDIVDMKIIVFNIINIAILLLLKFVFKILFFFVMKIMTITQLVYYCKIVPPYRKPPVLQ